MKQLESLLESDCIRWRNGYQFSDSFKTASLRNHTPQVSQAMQGRQNHVQDKTHVLKVPVKDPTKDGPALIQALSYLEEEPEKAKAMGAAGAKLVEELLAVDSNQR